MIRTRPEDHASVAAAIAAIKAEGGGCLELTGKYQLASDVLIDFDDVSVVGHGPGCGFIVTSGNTTGGLRVLGEYPGATNIPQNIHEWADSAVAITADFLQNDHSVQAQDASGFNAEDYVVIQARWKSNPPPPSSAGYNQWHTNQIISKAGSTLGLAAPLAFGAGAAYADMRIFKIAPRKNLRFANFSIWNESGAQHVHGLHLNCFRDSVVEGVVGHGFSEGRAISAGCGINNTFPFNGASKSGKNNPYSDIYLWGQTLAVDIGSRSYRATGFGQCWWAVNQSVIADHVACRPQGRGQKFNGSHLNIGGHLMNIAPLYTGFAMSFYSSSNNFVGISGHAPLGGAGAWFADTYSYRNMLTAVMADLSISPTDHNNAVFGHVGAVSYPTPNGSKVTTAWP